MNGGVEVEMVSVPKVQLVSLLNMAKQVRTGFLICAPRFAAGSRGESMAAAAVEMGDSIAGIERLLEPKRNDGK